VAAGFAAAGADPKMVGAPSARAAMPLPATTILLSGDKPRAILPIPAFIPVITLKRRARRLERTKRRMGLGRQAVTLR
jgi:hypothetical protein